jgi:DNA-binding NarL/FixJ family response regulator
LEPMRPTQHDEFDGRIRLVLADDRERTRRALRALLGAYSDLEVVGDAAEGARVIELVAREQPDVVIMDLRMPVVDGLQATVRIKQRWPRVRVLILSLAAEARDEALAVGADAFVVKGDPEDILLTTIRDLARAP